MTYLQMYNSEVNPRKKDIHRTHAIELMKGKNARS